jgi:hypothetical protein
MPFEPGCEPGPGRPKGSYGGRHRVLLLLDELFAREENLAALERALQAEFNENPTRFWRIYGVPLVPREAVLALLPKPPDPLDKTREMYLAVCAAVAEGDRKRAEEQKKQRELEGRPPLAR